VTQGRSGDRRARRRIHHRRRATAAGLVDRWPGGSGRDSEAAQTPTRGATSCGDTGCQSPKQRASPLRCPEVDNSRIPGCAERPSIGPHGCWSRRHCEHHGMHALAGCCWRCSRAGHRRSSPGCSTGCSRVGLKTSTGSASSCGQLRRYGSSAAAGGCGDRLRSTLSRQRPATREPADPSPASTPLFGSRQPLEWTPAGGLLLLIRSIAERSSRP
jgi:hypothetical protein